MCMLRSLGLTVYVFFYRENMLVGLCVGVFIHVAVTCGVSNLPLKYTTDGQ